MTDSHDVPGSYSCRTGDVLPDSTGTNGFSEHELLEIIYTTCDASNTGEVLASSIMKYLQTLTAQSTEEGRLVSLRKLLDPDLQDPHVSRETFHFTMRMWIAQCSQDSSDMCLSQPDYSEVSLNAPTETHQCSCERHDLCGVVADLKRAPHELREQNRSLLRMLAQCEDENLQLSLEITELQTKLASVQKSAVKAQSVTEELEETRQMLKGLQEIASHTQRSFTQLTNETERLRCHIRVLEDKHEKLTFERACAEESLNKLKRVNSELRAEHGETLTLMVLKDKEMTKKNILLDKMKNFHVENHKMIEGVQSELRRLHEHSHQQLLRLDRHCVTPWSPHSLNPPNQRSLQNEIQDLQQLHGVQGDNSVPLVNSHRGDIQCILHRIKSDKLAHHVQRKCPEKDRPFPLRQQQQAALKQQLCKVHQEPELHRSVWEEKRDKKDKEKEQTASQSGSQSQLQEAKKVVQVKVEEEVRSYREQAKVTQECLETQTKLLQTEDAISDMKKQVCDLHTALKSGQDGAEQKHMNQVPHFHKGDDTERQEEDTTVEKLVRDHRDPTVVLEPEKISASEPKQTEPQADKGDLLVTLGKIEAMVSTALSAAKLVRQSERRVSQVKEKMESITQKMEQTMDREAATDDLLEIREGRPSQSTGLALPAHPKTGTTSLLHDPGPEQKDGTELPSSSPVFPEIPDPPQLPMNAGTEEGECVLSEASGNIWRDLKEFSMQT